jgi:hypothetical protein
VVQLKHASHVFEVYTTGRPNLQLDPEPSEAQQYREVSMAVQALAFTISGGSSPSGMLTGKPSVLP